MDINSFIKSLNPLIAFRSVSSDSNAKEEIQKTAEWLNEYFKTNGYTSTLHFLPDSNPLVFAEYKVNEAAKTILLYGHYDVAATDDQESWTSDPFKLSKRNQTLYARGIADDKGQFFIHLHAISTLIQEKRLKVNVKIILEGNEEVENPNLRQFIFDNKDLLAADLVLVSDGPGIGILPTIEASLRGGFCVTLQYKTTDTPLHDGIYGGGVPNAAHEMALFLSKLIGEHNHVRIPNFYSSVDKIKSSEIESCRQLVPDESKFAQSLGLKGLLKKPGLNFYAQTGLQPTIQVNSIISGHEGEGYGTTVPNRATAKFEVHLVKSQDSSHILNLFKQFIKENTPSYIEFDITNTESGTPVKVDVSQPIFVKVQELIRKAYGQPAYIRYVGGSIPVVADFQEILNTEPLVLSLANEDSSEHGPDENLKIEVIEKAYNFSIDFFSSEIL
jgi:acetylornithine deacetylase/succinyl-diaminopimelate desuccinylase-like protein